MKIHVIAVGRWKAGPEKALFETYAKRLNTPLSLIEVEEKKKLPPTKLKEREGELLLAALPQGATVVALDERGKSLKSKDFAKKIGDWRDSGVRDLAFLIGGADGHSESVRSRADLLFSFGTMTWPHMLVRPLIAEQVYRAMSILSGHPYHRE